ncbi:thioesterase family protein [Sphaerisporangium sp. TRM90804]|uniref:acyl-CoA thioesterase n=1 Tax=Sphaerisporangium sp. TRM90804 TaxID=3031113 RepID=UPI002446EE12|nr:thioesterase family protein [Sphaerisporangium sp. TRM90804]MDH2425439.1 thioesterase family protein [Sphaerisporangium sp. TRM90804]
MYAHWETVPTRWKDNDVYGHVNNAVHYALMDTVINAWLVERAGLDIHGGAAIGLCVESHCSYTASVAFPEAIRVGLRVGRLGRTSVRYELGLFRSDGRTPVADGHFVHVFVDRGTRRPVEIPAPLRAAMEKLVVPAAGSGDGREDG